MIWVFLAFIIMFSAVLIVSNVINRRANAPSTRLRKMVKEAHADSAAPENTESGKFSAFVSGMMGRKLWDKLYAELTAAGLPIRPSEFVAIVIGFIALSQMFAFLALRTGVGHAMLGLIGLALPFIMLISFRRRRRAVFDAQIVDALVMMTAAFRSGFSMLRAMQMVAQEMPPPISKEFERILNEVGLGKPFEEALESAVERIESPDFELVVTAILVQLQVGGNLAHILETIADTIRERAKVLGEMKTLTAEGRISGIVLLALPISLAAILTTLNPTYMVILIGEPVGKMLILIAAALQALGWLVIRKMLVLDI